MADQVQRDIVVNITVNGSVSAIRALAQLEKAQLQLAKAADTSSKATAASSAASAAGASSVKAHERALEELRQELEAGSSAALDLQRAEQALQAVLASGTLSAEGAAAAQARLEQVQAELNQTTQATTEMSGRMRYGMIDVGYQITDFTTQVAGGTSALRAFSQQAPQAIGAIQTMFNTSSALGSFFMGPWGIAILTGVSVLASLVSVLFDTKKATDELTKANQEAVQAEKERWNSEDDLRLALAKTKQAYLDIRKEMEENVRKEQEATRIQLELAQLRLNSMENEINVRKQLNQEMTKPSADMGQYGAGAAAGAALLNMIQSRGDDAADAAGLQAVAAARKKNEDALTALNKAMINTVSAQKAVTAENDAAEKKAEAAAKKAEERAAKEHEKALQKIKDWEDYLALLNSGGDAIQKLETDSAHLNDALNSGKLSELGVAEAHNALKQNTDALAKAYEDLEIAQESQTGALVRQYNTYAEQQKEGNDQLQALANLIDVVTNPKMKNFYLDLYNTLFEKLNPELVKMNKALDERDAANQKTESAYTAGVGGKSASKNLEAINNQKQVVADLAIQQSAQDPGSAQYEALGKAVEKATDDLKKLQKQQDDTQKSLLSSEGTKVIVDGINAIGTAMADAIEGTKSWADAFTQAGKTIVAEIVKIMTEWLLFKAISGILGGAGGSSSDFLSGIKDKLFSVKGSAQGNVIENGYMKAFASGGVVNGPTIFPMANGGVGLMGEAGPEAIMPLSRLPNGQLGIQSQAPNVVVHNYAGVGVSTSTGQDGSLQIELRAIEGARKAISQDIVRGGNMVSRAMEGTYGVGRGRT